MEFVYDNEATVPETVRVLGQNPPYLSRKLRSHSVPHAEQNDAGSASTRGKEDLLKIQIEGEDNMIVGSRPGQENMIRRCFVSDVLPMADAHLFAFQGSDPGGREIHVPRTFTLALVRVLLR
jgi:hypothetical protein